MYASPCKDHKNCWLDLGKLRAKIKKPSDRSFSELWGKIDEANAAIKAAQTSGDKEALAKANAAHKKAWDDYNTYSFETSALYRTLLYSMRAHHRGRVHRLKERQPDGKIVQLDLAAQEAFLSTPAANRVFAELRKSVQPSPSC